MSTFSSVPNNTPTSLLNHHNSLFYFPSCLPSLSNIQRSHPKTSPVAFDGARLQHTQANAQKKVPGVLNSRFLQIGSEESSSSRHFLVKSTGAESAGGSTVSQSVSKWMFGHLNFLGLCMLCYFNDFLSKVLSFSLMHCRCLGFCIWLFQLVFFLQSTIFWSKHLWRLPLSSPVRFLGCFVYSPF